MTATSQMRVLTLNEDENHEVSLFRLEKGWSLHFVLGPSLSDKKVRVFINHPTDPKSGPNRQVYRELSWQNYSSSKGDVYDNFAEVFMVLAGSFNYYFTIDRSDKETNSNGCGYFLVDPILRCGNFDERLPLDSVCCQTVLTKCLGPFTEWEDRLRVAKESGYNMIHFTPIQALGASNSSYCIKDQMKLNPVFNVGKKTYSFEDVDKLVTKMKNDWDVLSLTDLVFNHTANESPWIQDHPECAFNLVNSPHLKPAYVLDRIVWKFSNEIAQGKWKHRGIPAEISTEEHLQALRDILTHDLIPKQKLHEYYLIDVDSAVNYFKNCIKSDTHSSRPVQASGDLQLMPDPKFRRLKCGVDMKQAVALYNVNHPHVYEQDERVDRCCTVLRHKLEQLNHEKNNEIQSHLEAAVNNIVANARWRFVDHNGPRHPLVIVDDEPIMWNYFTLPKEDHDIDEIKKLIDTDWGAYCMAHNGWVMGDDPLRNFAAPGSNVYLRRELIPWGDSVKLRFGNVPDDCPYLWKHMANYAMEAARIFHGIRLDNCHSTPIHVAEYMLDEARKVRPDLYVIAELFTSSEHMDNIFINRLGLNSLIREGLNANDPHDLGRLVHRHGGQPVGAFFQPPARPLTPSLAHAIFLDQTHDNPSPVERRSAFDLLPSSALIAMSCCATGSNRGYDEIVPHHINVVTEERLYTKWSNTSSVSHDLISATSGIVAAKKVLNKLHQDLSNKGFTQVYVDQIKGDVVAVTRHNPISHQSVILVARTAFSYPQDTATEHFILTAPGTIEEILFEGKTVHKNGAGKFEKNAKFINGLPDYSLKFRENIKVSESDSVEMCEQSSSIFAQEVEFVCFPPGSVIAFKVSLHHTVKKDVLAIRQTLSMFGYRMRTLSARNVSDISTTELENIIVRLTHNDLNRVLYRCDAEEKDDGRGFGAYDLPDYGPLPYCGLQGIMSVLRDIRTGDNLGHPLCTNIRNGDWLCDYVANRLIAFPTTHNLGEWFKKVFSHLTSLPRYLIPCYFDAIVTGVYMLVEEVAWAKMAEFVSTGSTFIRRLAMGSLQFCSVVSTASLPPISPSIAPPLPPTKVNDETEQKEQACRSLAAGLPHFAAGIWRNWGRDTFIALRGILLLTGQFQEARLIILSYAGTLRHGLIPNLLGSGTHARYNCRDSVWWWLHCIQMYCAVVPDGFKILKEKVSRMFPKDDSEPEPAGSCDQCLHEVIQEALQKHAEGLGFRERNAGHSLDNDMSPEGFNVDFGVDWNTGFVYGGNQYNCGTWMDKMGSSVKTGNKGQPATPRDGSAVELVGLCKSTIRWLADMYRQGHYPYDGVDRVQQGSKTKMTFQQWNQLIQTSFEKHFWVNTSPQPDEPRRDLINKRGIYKDCNGASAPWTDYQLRPNFPIAMVVAPELFTPSNAWTALEMMEHHLLGPLGMKTLDPSDWAYCGDYDNSNDGDEKKIAKGWNYHQGPEWVWPIGFFLRAKLYFATVLEKSQPGTVDKTINFIRNTLSKHNVHLQTSPWQSLPELTNQNGAHCSDSCAAQAWSVASILEVLHDLEKISK